ncbi:beta-ketoacyl synthase N-terminal-like domain-containing protein [Streptomyces sp. NPDC020800]|uniref:beta-ketoacyl synthase N-terminal-like domain-containing protein n=1 Tax=Streptomyces sp. NPDC020800 TaxID=3365092 RepID=UPI00378B608D
MTAHDQVPVAIVGMAVLLPGADSLDTYWTNLTRGVDAITDVPAHRWDATYYPDPIYCRRGGFVDDLAEVDLTRLGVMPDSIPGTEPDQLIALHVAARAIADAGGQERLPARDRIGIVLGRGGYLTSGQARLDQRVRTARQLTRTLDELLPEIGPDRLAQLEAAFAEQLGPERPESAIGLVPNLVASRIANRLDLRGPAWTTDAACASSLVAVDQAVTELARSRCDLMLAGGVHHCHDITLWSVFAQLRALSQSGRSRPFHTGADGILIGEGTGVVVLKRLADAERDGDRVYAVVRGTAVATDGRAASLMNPHPAGQARAVRQAWQAAGLDPMAPASLGLLEAHGTGTPAGDTAELTMIADVFGGPGQEEPGVIGSVKSMIGHTMPAAGVAGLVKAALAVHHGTLLPTLHCEEPHPLLQQTRFRPLHACRPWDVPVRRAAVSAFGFGGVNAHVVLEQARHSAPASAYRWIREPERVLRLAADSRDALAALLDADNATLTSRAETRPPAGTARIAVVAPDARSLALARRAVAKGQAWRGRGDVWFTTQPLLSAAAGGTLAFVFPGLEAAFEPRLEEVADHFALPLPHRRAEGTVVGDVARHGIGVLGVGRVLNAALCRLGIVPDAVAGHSIGEWAAMLAGGIFDDSTADALLADFDPDALRVPGVVFAAIGAPAHRVQEIIGSRADVVLSHDNAPSQSMICGSEAAIAEMVQAFRDEHVVAQVLTFRSGFHTPMLVPYLRPFTDGVRRAALRPALIPVWSGTTAAPFPSAPEAVRELFVRHLVEPVRFRALVEAMYKAGHRAFIQVGTGQLTTLIADTLKARDHLVISANESRRCGLAQLRRVAAALWTEGRGQAMAAVTSGALPAPPALVRPVKLELGAALVSLPQHIRATLRTELLAALPQPAPIGTGNAAHTGEPVLAEGPVGALDALAARFPAVADLQAAITETATTALTLFTTASRPAMPLSRLTSSSPPAPAIPPAVSDAPAALAPRPTAPTPVRPRSGEDAREETSGRHRSRLTVSTSHMPYLIDHCFIPQRPGWPDLADRHPVVPATTILAHMAQAAERSLPGRRTIGVQDLRLDQWLAAEPVTHVEVVVAPEPDGRHAAVTFGPYARAVLELAERYPAHPPVCWRLPADERPCTITAAELYRDRWMFHGPQFQGVAELTAIGDRHVRGTLTAPQAPGALLDNVGQLLGHWILAERPDHNVVFPVRMRAFRFFGPPPPAGAETECHIRIRSVTATVLTADVQLTRDGIVWAEVDGWQDRRFSVVNVCRPGGYPERRALSTLHPGGWTVLEDAWPDLASRDLVMRTHLGAAERTAYAQHPPRGRRQWLLGRIAAKDAVRHLLWDQGEAEIFPAEIRIDNDTAGRPRAEGLHGRKLPPLQLSLAHCEDAAVALARPATGGAGVGIDIEMITERPSATHHIALGGTERRLLHDLHTSSGEPESVWFTRFWAAKEAAAKAEGTGLRGRPKDFAVEAAWPGGLLIKTARHRHRVHIDRLAAGVSTKDYVVAWTHREEEL